MAKAKKVASKPAKKVSAKSVKASKASAPRAAPKKTPKKLLSIEDKQRLVKPIDGFTEIAERFAAAWGDHKALKVAGLSPAKLLRAVEIAKRSAARENALRSKFEEKLRPLSDARLLAEHEAWKMVLDAYAVAKALTRVDPELGHAFAFVGDAMTPRPKKKTNAAEPGNAGGTG